MLLLLCCSVSSFLCTSLQVIDSIDLLGVAFDPQKSIMVTSTRETERNLIMKSHELIAQITRATAKINEERIALKDKQIARLMDQVANLKSEKSELQEAFNYVATDFKSLQKEILEEMRIENTQA